jgi:sulfoxide reductase heme-binding subunit YedZ
LLLALSNDLSLRRLGTRKWKSLQRWTYAAVALTIAHGVAYQQIEKRQQSYRTILWITTAILAAVQIAGWWQTQRKQTHESS